MAASKKKETKETQEPEKKDIFDFSEDEIKEGTEFSQALLRASAGNIDESLDKCLDVCAKQEKDSVIFQALWASFPDAWQKTDSVKEQISKLTSEQQRFVLACLASYWHLGRVATIARLANKKEG